MPSSSLVSRRFAIALIAAAAAAPMAQAEDATFATTLKGKAFEPAEIKVPAGKPFVLKMTNANASPAELESKEMRVEKVAAGNAEIVVRIKALKPGRYKFVDEYQEDDAIGYIVAE